MQPAPARIFATLDATWPSAATFESGPWLLREGRGGGQRVSAATRRLDACASDIESAEARMCAMKQDSLFMIRPEDTQLDAWLEDRFYKIVDPVTIYVAPVADLACDLPAVTAMPVWPPLAVQREIWESGGIGDARLAVMNRVSLHKTSLLGRLRDKPAATAFVACDAELAMLHALEVPPVHRRNGLGRRMMQGAANWARDQGARWIAVAVTRANAPAVALYQSLGMVSVAHYHYRRARVSIA